MYYDAQLVALGIDDEETRRISKERSGSSLGVGSQRRGSKTESHKPGRSVGTRYSIEQQQITTEQYILMPAFASPSPPLLKKKRKKIQSARNFSDLILLGLGQTGSLVTLDWKRRILVEEYLCDCKLRVVDTQHLDSSKPRSRAH